jgi:hypothetical protein
MTLRDLHPSRNDVVHLEGGEPKMLQAARVSLEWFDAFAARPALGRTFVEEEDEWISGCRGHDAL